MPDAVKHVPPPASPPDVTFDVIRLTYDEYHAIRRALLLGPKDSDLHNRTCEDENKRIVS